MGESIHVECLSRMKNEWFEFFGIITGLGFTTSRCLAIAILGSNNWQLEKWIFILFLPMMPVAFSVSAM